MRGKCGTIAISVGTHTNFYLLGVRPAAQGRMRTRTKARAAGGGDTPRNAKQRAGRPAAGRRKRTRRTPIKRKILSILLALCLALTLLPVAAFAEGSEEELPVCTCETACAVESLNADCPVCGAEGASAENCAKYVKPADDVPTQSESEPVVLNGEDETENVTWKDIGQGDTELLKTSGNYKLTENIDNLNALDIGNFYNAEITLDLNGFTLTGADNSYYTLWIHFHHRGRRNQRWRCSW